MKNFLIILKKDYEQINHLYSLNSFLNIMFFISYCLLLACESKWEPYNPDYTSEINVFALLSSDVRYEFVLVERTMQLTESDIMCDSSGFHYINRTIEEAIVKIISKN